MNCDWVPPPQLQARGFLQLHGVDGSPGMLEQARARGLYQRLSLCTLGQEPLPSSEGTPPPPSAPQGTPSDQAHLTEPLSFAKTPSPLPSPPQAPSHTESYSLFESPNPSLRRFL